MKIFVGCFISLLSLTTSVWAVEASHSSSQKADEGENNWDNLPPLVKQKVAKSLNTQDLKALMQTDKATNETLQSLKVKKIHKVNLNQKGALQALIEYLKKAKAQNLSVAIKLKFAKDGDLEILSPYLDVISTLDLSDNFFIRDVSALVNAKRLHTLNLSGTSIGDVSALANILQLHTLDLSFTKITDVSALVNAKRLHTLNLTRTQIGDVSALANIPQLHTLDLSFNSQLVDVSALGNATQLRNVDLNFNPQIEDVNALANIPQLEKLSMMETRITNFSAFAKAKHLHTLNLDGGRISDVSTLAKIPQLHTLILSDTQVEDVSALAHVPNIIF